VNGADEVVAGYTVKFPSLHFSGETVKLKVVTRHLCDGTTKNNQTP
jgi:hypothetical protein